MAAGIIYTFKSGEDPDFLTGDGLTYFMPALTALVGGVVAVAFGVPAPSNGGTDGGPTPVQRLDAVLAPSQAKADGGGAIGKGYVLLYLILGAIAGVAWILKGGDTIEYVKTLAAAWGGLMIPIASSFFSQPS